MLPLSFSNSVELSLRGKINYIHDAENSMSSAFEINEAGKIQILLPRHLGVISACLDIYNSEVTGLVKSIWGEWDAENKEYDSYVFSLNIKEINVGLYYFNFKLDCVYGKIYGVNDRNSIKFSAVRDNTPYFQLSVSDFKYPVADQKYGGIIYHIFVDRFNRGGKVEKKDSAILVDDWFEGVPEYPEYPGAPLKNNTFYGGTLYGIVNKLDYIKSLGVTIIYLSPIFDSPSNHKYDTGDYMKVDAMFGGDEALKTLIEKANSIGIDIILDGVFNHTGSDSIYFNKNGNYDSIGAYQSEDSPFFSWFDFQNFPDKYTCWWGIKILPRINTNKKEVVEYFTGTGGVVDKYSKMGVLGFRLDVVDELPDCFISLVKERLEKNNKKSLLYGEVWEDASNKISYGIRKKYYLGKELDGVMNYPLRTGIIDYITKGKTESLKYALCDIINNAPKRIRNMQMNFLGTHDTDRIITVLGGESPEGKSNDYLAKKVMSEKEIALAVERLKMAYTILLTLPGIPSVFYGDEAGLQGYHDPFNRMPYPWGHEDKELLSFCRNIGKLRTENHVYREGDFHLINLDKKFLCFDRTEDGKAYVTCVNNSKTRKKILFSKNAVCLTDFKNKEDVYYDYNMEKYTSAVFKVDLGTKISVL